MIPYRASSAWISCWKLAWRDHEAHIGHTRSLAPACLRNRERSVQRCHRGLRQGRHGSRHSWSRGRPDGREPRLGTRNLVKRNGLLPNRRTARRLVRSHRGVDRLRVLVHDRAARAEQRDADAVSGDADRRGHDLDHGRGRHQRSEHDRGRQQELHRRGVAEEPAAAPEHDLAALHPRTRGDGDG